MGADRGALGRPAASSGPLVLAYRTGRFTKGEPMAPAPRNSSHTQTAPFLELTWRTVRECAVPIGRSIEPDGSDRELKSNCCCPPLEGCVGCFCRPTYSISRSTYRYSLFWLISISTSEHTQQTCTLSLSPQSLCCPLSPRRRSPVCPPAQPAVLAPHSAPAAILM